VGETAGGILKQMDNFKFVFYANLLNEIFETKFVKRQIF
jgi:hypothetical protein